MKPSLKWMLVPPALALVLVATFSSGSQPDGATGEPLQSTPATSGLDPSGLRNDGAQGAQTGTEDAEQASPTRISTAPSFDAWRIASTLAGVLLLGGVALVLLRRTGKGPRVQGEPPVRVRHSQRLSPKARLHVVEFEGQVLLVGEAEGHVSLLSEPAHASHTNDEADVLSRDEDDQGAVPRDMVLTPKGPRQVAPKQPQIRNTAGQPRTQAQAAGGNNLLHDFRDLLDRVKAGQA